MLFAQAKILADAEITKVLERTTAANENRPLVVEAKITKVYKGDKKLVGKSIELSGSVSKGNCSFYPPGKIGMHIMVEGPEPYRFSGGCHFVWSPEAGK